MRLSTKHIIISIIVATIIFLTVATFLLLYVRLYNKRKKKHIEEKKMMQQAYEEELVKTQMEVQEQTLKTIASDIHDNIGQLLSITKLTLSTIKVDADPVRAQEKVDNALDLVSDSIKELRQLASVLHADNLLVQGLEHAIENELKWLSKSDVYEVIWNVTGKPTSKGDASKELIAFRIVQELLNNTIKHSKATKINVSLEYSDHGRVIKIEDNGNGFNVADSLKEPTGLGLTNLFKRAKILDGELVLNSEETKGTCALLSLPYTA